jgi:hypothetical protein
MVEYGTTIAVGFWVPTGLVVGGLGAIVAITYLLDRPRLRRLRREHLQSHPPISEEEFIRLAGVRPDRGNVAIGVRNGAAEIMHVPPETIYPSDSLEYIFMMTSMDGFLDLSLFAGKALGIRFPNSFWKPLFPVMRNPRDVLLSEVARFGADNWDTMLASQAERSKKK